MTLQSKQYQVNIQTNPTIPPPYAHTCRIVVDENPAYLVLSYKLRYTERDELTEDEILDEGFSMDDDFSWSGKLNKVWKEQFESILKSTRLNTQLSSSSDYAIEIRTKEGDSEEKGYVSKRETQRWVYFIQEIKQAIFESEKIEVPLAIEYRRIENKRETKVLLNGVFLDRSFTIRVDDRPVEQLDWSILQHTIDLIFNETEIDYEEQLNGRPVQDGHYLQLPGLGWFQLEVGITARYDDISILENIVKTMEAFIKGEGGRLLNGK
ncbi:hypothetical protein GCM10023091_14400 [Ravibacter arvi]|uniref:Uncharacterized protein n=1 Tax=Ravibacter arvi TaxID=2051041 RepID=A0ABP8LTJ5_9BACT